MIIIQKCCGEYIKHNGKQLKTHFHLHIKNLQAKPHGKDHSHANKIDQHPGTETILEN